MLKVTDHSQFQLTSCQSFPCVPTGPDTLLLGMGLQCLPDTTQPTYMPHRLVPMEHPPPPNTSLGSPTGDPSGFFCAYSQAVRSCLFHPSVPSTFRWYPPSDYPSSPAYASFLCSSHTATQGALLNTQLLLLYDLCQWN